ncbi:MAG: hypothetical protein P0Y53_13710 [Candidatus Pseudobacter hemicellulosilyticus]|uniref:Uncharacterized protein n=1 Tax=Candidatus Pseudobacter hemicellulosilyticus TaxID=3121375 RepID=A0AAJ6BDZ0_9BACT|nr:MAG: hypothetical protein P0Y53_13710 [Pseudobacter sp.]
MIKEIAQSRRLRKITLATSALVMSAGLVTSLTSFQSSGAGCYPEYGHGEGWDAVEEVCPTEYWKKVTTYTTGSGAGVVYVDSGHEIENTGIYAAVSGYYNPEDVMLHWSWLEAYKECCVQAPYYYYSCTTTIPCSPAEIH